MHMMLRMVHFATLQSTKSTKTNMGKKLDNQPFATINYIYGGACEIQVYPDPFSEMVRLPFRFLVLQTSKTSSWGHKIIQNPQESYQESGWSVPRILVSNRIWNFSWFWGDHPIWWRAFNWDEAACCGLYGSQPELWRKAGIVPVVKQIDTLAAEYPAETNYLRLGQLKMKCDIRVYVYRWQQYFEALRMYL